MDPPPPPPSTIRKVTQHPLLTLAVQGKTDRRVYKLGQLLLNINTISLIINK